MSDSINDALLEMFIFETSQLLEQLEQVILMSEAELNYSEETINEIFRIMHTIKGSSTMMRYGEISALTHAIEDLFSYLRQGSKTKYSFSDLNDLILDCIDFIKIELEKIRNNDKADGNAAGLVNRVKDFLSSLMSNTGEESEQQDKAKVRIFSAVIHFQEGCEMENVRAFAVIHNLKKAAIEMIYHPRNIEVDPGSVEIIRRDGFHIYIKTDKTQDEIEDRLLETIFLKKLELAEIDEETYSMGFPAEVTADSPDISVQDAENGIEPEKAGAAVRHDKTVSAAPGEGSAENKGRYGAERHSAIQKQSIISVSVAKLDRLMELVGEMVIAEAMVLQNPDLEGLELDNFNKAANQLSKITSEIQDMVMSVRMVPLSATFQRMKRIVRDMCKKLNKEAQLEIIGEETEVDKNVIEHISDPLMHLVRNAVDHGIETAEERLLAGKPKEGKITLEAKNAGSDVHINVRDDGRGLSRDKILEKARAKNLVTKNEEDMSDSEVYKLILMPGFSTSDSVTEFSGRGVGMDVVVKNIESIGGSISIDSENGSGTQITLKIPLTLAIIDGMNLQVGRSIFTIPTSRKRYLLKQ